MFIIICLCSNARSYIVYSIKGNVILNQCDSIKTGSVLSSTDILRIDENAKLIILVEDEKRLYTIDVKCSGKLDELIKRKECSTRQLADSYLAFIKKKIFNSGNVEEKNYMQTAGTVFRETDSTVINAIITKQQKDSLRKHE